MTEVTATTIPAECQPVSAGKDSSDDYNVGWMLWGIRGRKDKCWQSAKGKSVPEQTVLTAKMLA